MSQNISGWTFLTFLKHISYCKGVFRTLSNIYGMFLKVIKFFITEVSWFLYDRISVMKELTAFYRYLFWKNTSSYPWQGSEYASGLASYTESFSDTHLTTYLCFLYFLLFRSWLCNFIEIFFDMHQTTYLSKLKWT